MNVFELVATLGLDTTGFTAGLGMVSGAIGTLTSTVIGFGRDVIETGMGFDSAMASVRAVLGETEGSMENMESLRAYALEQARTSIFTAEEAANAYYYMGMAGWKSEQMTAGLPAIMALAAASGEDLATVSDIVTDSLTAFGLGADQASNYADILAQAATNSNTNVAMMGETFKYVAPIAGALGADVDDVAMSIGLMADQGIKASMAGTSMRQIFTRISTNAGETKNNIGALTILTEKLGVAFRDENGHMRDWGDIVKECRVAWKDLDEATQIYYAKQIAGERGMTAWLAMMNASEEKVTQLEEAFANAGGAAQKMADTRLDSLAGDIEYFSSAYNILKQTIFDDVKGPMREIVQWATDAINDITEAISEEGLAGGVRVLGEKIAEAGDIFQPLMEGIGKAAQPILDQLTDTLIDKLPTAAEKLIGALLASLGDALTAEGDGPGGLLGFVVGMAGYGLQITAWLKGLFKPAAQEAGKEFITSVYTTATDPTMVEDGANIIATFMGDPTMIPDSVGAAITENQQTIADPMEDALEAAATPAADQMLTDIGAKLGELTSPVQAAIEAAGFPAGQNLASAINTELQSYPFTINVTANVQGLPTQHNASAMDTGRIFTRPTIFGYANSAFQVAGDAGAEAVVGVSSLQSMISRAVRAAVGANAPREIVIPRENTRPVNVIFEFDGIQKMIYRLNKAEEQRVGVQLKGGG